MRLKNKNIFVTGGAGFLGGALAEDLAKDNTVTILDDLSIGKRESIPEGCTFSQIRLNSENLKYTVLPHSDDIDIIFHFAAPCTILLFDKNPMALYMNAVESAYAIREFADRFDVPYLVYASSATWYGNTANRWFYRGKRFTELSGLRYQEEMPAAPANIYGATKVAEESFDSLFPNTKYLGLRIFPSYGAREWLKGNTASIAYKVADAVLNDKELEIWGYGGQCRDYIYIDDFVYITEELVRRGAEGIFNIGSGKETSHNTLIDIARKLTENFDWKPKYVSNPYHNSYLHTLKSSQEKTLEWIGKYKFISIDEGMSLMLDGMVEREWNSKPN